MEAASYSHLRCIKGLRLALLRHKSLTQGDKKGLALIVNTAWLAAPLTALFALLLAVLTLAYQHQQQDDEGHSGEYFMALLIYSVSVVIEAACEPAYTVAQNQMNFGVRVTSEAVALVARSAVAVVSVVWARQELLGFAYAQLAYAVACLVCYYGHFWLWPMPIVSSPLDLTPHISGDSALDTPTLSLAYSFTKQSFLKHILTEGDRLVLSLQSSHFDQGVYGAVTNIGNFFLRNTWYFISLIRIPGRARPVPADRGDIPIAVFKVGRVRCQGGSLGNLNCLEKQIFAYLMK